MATRRRPRTRVYDCNYHIGESYYKPVMDSLDRKYSGRPLDGVTPAGERENTPSRAGRLFSDRDRDRDESPFSRPSRLMAEFESNGIDKSAHKPSRGSMLADDDDAAIDAEFEETMKRIKAARAARNKELEDEFESFATKKKINIADHLLDSVGINKKSQRALEDEVIAKHQRSAKKFFDDDEDDKVMTKWTAIAPGAKALQEAEEAAEESSAMVRARKSRAKLQDIDSELEELQSKSAARQKRIADLKALVGESEESSRDAAATVKVSKRISVKATSEKKQVSF